MIMSKLQELINELCPDGVEYKTLNELGLFYGGLTGKSKKDFSNGNSKFITYKNVYSNPSLNLDIDDMVFVGENEKQRPIEYGDIIFTGSSETLDECAFSSVVTKRPKTNMYLNSFCFIFRLNELNLFNLDFLKHLFRSSEIRKELIKTASGVTRFNVSKEKMGKVSIPVPPLPVQEEIVRILDKMTGYVNELKAELKARKMQYEYYKNNLLSFSNVLYKSLEEVCDIVDYRGKTPRKVDKGLFLVTAKNIKKGYIDYDISKEFIAPEEYAEIMRRGIPKIGDVLITTEAPCGNVAQVDKENIALAQRVIKYWPKNSNLNSSFLKYILLSKEFQDKLLNASTGGTVKGIKGSRLHKLTVPIPSIKEQIRIVAILDRFDRLCNDISSGLPAEIEARQKQYEYYRDKLLRFEEISHDTI